MKNISVESLEEILNAKLVGTKYDNYGIGGRVYGVVEEAIQLPDSEYRVSFTVDKGQTVTIKYRNCTVAQFFVKKKKGSRHYNCIDGAYYDWTISDVRAQYWPEDIVEEFKKVDQSIIDGEIEKKNRLVELGKNFAKIKALFPDLSEWSIFSMLTSMAGYKYNDDFRKAAGLD